MKLPDELPNSDERNRQEFFSCFIALLSLPFLFRGIRRNTFLRRCLKFIILLGTIIFGGGDLGALTHGFASPTVFPWEEEHDHSVLGSIYEFLMLVSTVGSTFSWHSGAGGPPPGPTLVTWRPLEDLFINGNPGNSPSSVMNKCCHTMTCRILYFLVGLLVRRLIRG